MHSTLAVLVVAAALAIAGCKKEADSKPDEPATKVVQEEAKAPEKKPTPAKPISSKELSLRLQEIFKVAKTRDKAQMAKFFTEDVVLTYNDFVPALEVKGRDNVLAGMESFWKGFPDVQGEANLMLISGQQVVTVNRTVGTNSGDFRGQPATNKKIGLIHAAHIEVSPQGQIARETAYIDQSSFAGQLGMVPEGHFRPAVEKTGNPPEVVIAADSDEEAENVEKIKQLAEAFNAHEVDKVMSYYTDTAVFSHSGSPVDHKGKEAIAEALKAFYAMASDVKNTNEWVWGAGDYVVARSIIEATNDGPFPGGTQKATNKKYRISELTVYKFAGGKIAEHWIFSNNMSFAVQLGLIDPATGKPPADKGAAEAAPGKDSKESK